MGIQAIVLISMLQLGGFVVLEFWSRVNCPAPDSRTPLQEFLLPRFFHCVSLDFSVRV